MKKEPDYIRCTDYIKKDCEFYYKGDCKALSELVCENKKCSFYKRDIAKAIYNKREKERIKEKRSKGE